MINLGCHSENFGILSPEDTFSFISRLGFRYIDVASRSLVPQESIIADPKGRSSFLRELSEANNLQLDELFLGAVEADGVMLQPAAGDEKLNEKAYRVFNIICAFAKLAGFQSVMGAPGSEVPALGYGRSFDNAAEVHKKMIKIAADNGLNYHVEPSRTSLCNVPQKAIEMVQAAPGLRYTLDFLHYQINAVPQKESMELIPYAGHMHARQAKTGIGKCRFEEGEIDYDSIVKRLSELNWAGSIVMEFWNNPEHTAAGINAVEQNIRMKYELKCLINKYCGYMPE